MKPSVQLKSTHPLHAVVDTINHNGGPYIALVMAYPTEELVLLHSGLFLPNSNLPWIDLSGTATYSLSLSIRFLFSQMGCPEGWVHPPKLFKWYPVTSPFPMCIWVLRKEIQHWQNWGCRCNLRNDWGANGTILFSLPFHICDHCCLPIQFFLTISHCAKTNFFFWKRIQA